MKNENQAVAKSNDVVRNGVNVTELASTIHAIQADLPLGECKFRARNKWLDGGHCRTAIGGFYGAGKERRHSQDFQFDADEPPMLLGGDRGANPVEYVLTALSSCMTTTLAYQAAAQGIEIEAIDSSYEGDLDLKGFLEIDPSIRRGYQEIRTVFRVKSAADAEKIKELLQKSPVYDIVTNPTKVKIDVIAEK